MRLDRVDGLPDRLLDLAPRDVRAAFPNPTLVRVAGRAPEPVFVSALLHGDETTSFFVLQNIARRVASRMPARSLLIFVGNVDAAEAGVRRLPDQPDFNRVWAGGEGEAVARAAAVTAEARAAGVVASIDIHNTSGTNPLYGCVSSLAPEHVNLAALFTRRVIVYDNPPTTQSIAFSKFCPATTIECGQPGNAEGVARATDFVFDVLNARTLTSARPADVEAYRTVGRIVVEPDAGFAYGAPADVEFAADLDHLNFTDLDAGAPLARARGGRAGLRVFDEAGRDVTARFLAIDDGVIRLARPATPSMLTTNAAIARMDCLGYLMERIG